MKYGIIYAVLIMVLGFIIMQIFPGKLLSIFEATPLMMEMGIPAIRIISTSFLFAGFCIACSSIFQAFGKGFLSMMISIVRQLLVLLPVAFLMSLSGNITMVWLAWPIAELFSLLLSILFLVNVNRKIIRPMADE